MLSQTYVNSCRYSIKKSIRYAYDNNFESVVCVDDDGQHHIDDIIKVIEYANTNKSFFVIGVRKFTKKIPKRSFFGNKLTLIITTETTRFNTKHTCNDD